MPNERSPEPLHAPSRGEWTSARLAAWRREIDAVDRGLLELLQQRGELVLRIGRLKRQAGIAAHDPVREDVILANLAAAAADEPGAFDASAVVDIFRAVLQASLRLHAAEPSSDEAAPAARAGAAIHREAAREP